MILSDKKRKFASAYLNDIVIFSNERDQNIDHDCNIFPFLYNTKTTLKRKLKKYSFFTQPSEFPDHVARPRHLERTSLTSNTINGLEFRASITTITWIIGLGKVFKRFEASFFQITFQQNQQL